MENKLNAVVNEKYLWHGTNAKAVDSINSLGFGMRFVGAHGEVYKYIWKES